MTATVPSGQRTYTGSAAGPITFADRYQYLLVTNTGSNTLYLTSDGSPPSTSGAGNTQVVFSGQTTLIANEQPLWYQSSTVLVNGTQSANGQSRAGGLANPGVVLNFAGTSPEYTIEAAG